jgi:hypothetical protein
MIQSSAILHKNLHVLSCKIRLLEERFRSEKLKMPQKNKVPD